jgi:hypothetical protein
MSNRAESLFCKYSKNVVIDMKNAALTEMLERFSAYSYCCHELETSPLVYDS